MTSVFSDGLCFEALNGEIQLSTTINYSFNWIILKRNGKFIITNKSTGTSLECGDKVWVLGTLEKPSGTSATTGLFRSKAFTDGFSNMMFNVFGDICSITKQVDDGYSQCDSTTKWDINCNYMFSGVDLCNASDVVFPFMKTQLIGTGMFVNSPYLSFGPNSYNTFKFFNNMYENNYNLKTIKDEKYLFCSSQHSCFAKCRSMMSVPVLEFSNSAGSVSNLLFDCNNIRGLVFHGAKYIPSYSWSTSTCFSKHPTRRTVVGFDKTILSTSILDNKHSLQYFRTAESVNSVSVREKGGYYAKSDTGKGFREKTEHATDTATRDNSYVIRKASNDFCQEWIEY